MRGPPMVSGCRGARIRGRSRASVSDAIGVVRYLQVAVVRGPRVVSGYRGARIRERSRPSIWDAIIRALKHRIPSEFRS